ncbi:hypothetical protein BCY91_12700 [Pelobium manganitolerans]|uniref:Uncharacterized protein n=1 Tax=Pelobium manganitolerans TaxID=1842495 RepID=A0A419S208_9SPHI|nr:hypothetical protein [Pelobium manganitolerans]RKD12497.1 hypothetical protein BCY91_12700 [Pelobium manganitolerans]
MTKVIMKGPFAGLSKKSGEMVLYVRNGKTYLRKLPAKPNGRQPSEKQKLVRQRFGFVQDMVKRNVELAHLGFRAYAGRECKIFASSLLAVSAFNGERFEPKMPAIKFSYGKLRPRFHLRLENTDGQLNVGWGAPEKQNEHQLVVILAARTGAINWAICPLSKKACRLPLHKNAENYLYAFTTDAAANDSSKTVYFGHMKKGGSKWISD